MKAEVERTRSYVVRQVTDYKLKQQREELGGRGALHLVVFGMWAPSTPTTHDANAGS